MGFLLEALLWAAFGIFYVYHFSVIYQNAVNVPYLDEWDEFPRQPLWPWLWTPHNEHIILTTKLLIWLLWRLDGWNFAVHQYVNWALFGVLLASLGIFLKRQVPSLPGGVVALLLTWMLSPRLFQNHSWGFQSQWHFMALFLLGAVHFLFRASGEGQRWRDLGIGLVCAAACAFSLSSGVIAVVVLALVFTAFKVLRARARAGEGRRESRQLLVCGACLLAMVAAYGMIVRSQHVPVQYTPVTRGEFWSFFCTLVGAPLSFAVSPETFIWLGAGLLLYYAMPWFLAAIRPALLKGTDANCWSLGAVTLALLGVFASIAVGRARFGLDQAGASRYCEFTMIMVPIVVASSWAFAGPKRNYRALVVAFVAIVFVPAFCSSLRFFRLYGWLHDQRVSGVVTLGRAYALDTDAVIPELYPKVIPVQRLREARELHLSFINAIAGPHYP